jgi:hypothetical protein
MAMPKKTPRSRSAESLKDNRKAIISAILPQEIVDELKAIATKRRWSLSKLVASYLKAAMYSERKP